MAYRQQRLLCFTALSVSQSGDGNLLFSTVRRVWKTLNTDMPAMKPATVSSTGPEYIADTFPEPACAEMTCGKYALYATLDLWPGTARDGFLSELMRRPSCARQCKTVYPTTPEFARFKRPCESSRIKCTPNAVAMSVSVASVSRNSQTASGSAARLNVIPL